MRKQPSIKTIETRNALITVERDGVQTTVIYLRKPKNHDANQLRLFG